MKHLVLWWCLHHITHYECNTSLSLDGVCWCWKLTSCSIYPLKIACSSHHQPKTLKDAPFQNLIVSGHTHGLEEGLIIGVGQSSTSFPSIGSSIKSKPKWIFLPHAKSTDLATLYFASTKFLPYQLHIFINRHFFTSKI